MDLDGNGLISGMVYGNKRKSEGEGYVGFSACCCDAGKVRTGEKAKNL
jgi:hypothetical protein